MSNLLDVDIIREEMGIDVDNGAAIALIKLIVEEQGTEIGRVTTINYGDNIVVDVVGNVANVSSTDEGGITDAPVDGVLYGRKDADWEAIEATAGTVTSVNTIGPDITGNVEIDTDDIDDSSSVNKYVTEEQIGIINNVKIERFETFTMTSAVLTAGYITIIGEITDNQNILVFVDNIGVKAEQGVDFSISGNQIFWAGYLFSSKLEEGDILKIFYVSNT